MKVLIIGSDKVFSIENFYVKYLKELGVNLKHFTAQAIFYDYYYDGGICNNCPIDMVDELCTIAFDLGKNEKSNIKIIDLFNCLVDNINKKPENAITFKVLDSKFNNQQLNINQSRDDIFNIYMSGYNLSKSVLFDNFIALKAS